MLSREDLYDLVWSMPMTKVGEQYQVSGSYMARVCTLLNVPRPERGYWAKLAVGKACPPEPLPEARPGDQLFWTRDGQLPPAPSTQRPPRRSAKTQVVIPRTRVHRLIQGARGQFENTRRVDDDGYLKPYKKLLVDVTASKAGLDKALAFTSDLFNALESVGHRVVLAPNNEHFRRTSIDEREVRTKRSPYHHTSLWSPWRPTVVFGGDVAIGLAVVEMSEGVLMRYVSGKYIRDAEYVPPKPSRYRVDHTWTITQELPCNRLRLIAYSPYWGADWSSEWNETKTARLEPSIASVVKAIEAAAVEIVAKLEEAARRAEIARREQIIAEEKRRREEDRRRVEQSVRDSLEHLRQVIVRWADAVSVENFLAGVEQHAADLPVDQQAHVLEKLHLARQLLGTQDPLSFFLRWLAPQERYRSIYPSADDAPAALPTDGGPE